MSEFDLDKLSKEAAIRDLINSLKWLFKKIYFCLTTSKYTIRLPFKFWPVSASKSN